MKNIKAVKNITVETDSDIALGRELKEDVEDYTLRTAKSIKRAEDLLNSDVYDALRGEIYRIAEDNEYLDVCNAMLMTYDDDDSRYYYYDVADEAKAMIDAIKDANDWDDVIDEMMDFYAVAADSGMNESKVARKECPLLKDSMNEDKKVCVLCGESFKGHGNNPAPLKDSGECCDECNKRKVIPARIKALKKKKDLTEAIPSQRIRVVLDLATPTANRTFTTHQDVRKNFIVKYFKDKGELAGYLAELDGYEDYDDFKQELADSGDDLEDFEFKGDEQDVAIQYLLDAMSDPGDGTPNIQFISIDGKPAYEEYWVQYDAFYDADSLLSKGTKRQIVDYYLSNLEESFAPRRTPFSIDREGFEFDDDPIIEESTKCEGKYDMTYDDDYHRCEKEISFKPRTTLGNWR